MKKLFHTVSFQTFIHPKMKNLLWAICLFFGFGLSTSQVSVKQKQVPTQQKAKQPNIIVILTDDMGYADLGIQGYEKDVKTPHLDSLARQGVRFTNGYVTAPQCAPSRAGLLTGRYQQRFGLEEIPDCPLSLKEVTLADRLKKVGYRTGMVGKWHLEPNALSANWVKENMPNAVPEKGGRYNNIPMAKRIPYMPYARGFDEFFTGELNNYWANLNVEDTTILPAGKMINQPGYRLDIQTAAAKQFIKRHKENPFFLYVGYYGPHVPLVATQKYLDKFPGNMPERRRYALAMIAAIDEGVGELCRTLKSMGLDENTVIIFTSDNGAPLGITKTDVPVTDDSGKWDGSLNTPLLGEKGMLSEGGIKVPFFISGAGIPKGQIYSEAISTLDIAPTCLGLAGSGIDPVLDGTNLIPYLTKQKSGVPHKDLFWRFWTQTAVRSGNYKYINAGKSHAYLFDLAKDPEEKNNIIAQKSALAKQLKKTLESWTNELTPAGMPQTDLRDQEVNWYNHYLEKK